MQFIFIPFFYSFLCIFINCCSCVKTFLFTVKNTLYMLELSGLSSFRIQREFTLHVFICASLLYWPVRSTMQDRIGKHCHSMTVAGRMPAHASTAVARPAYGAKRTAWAGSVSDPAPRQFFYSRKHCLFSVLDKFVDSLCGSFSCSHSQDNRSGSCYGVTACEYAFF